MFNDSDNILSGKTILVVDNESINRTLFGLYLQQTGAHILYAEHGKDAVNMACNGTSIDLVSMDIKMPVLNGFEALERIKAHYTSKGKYIPIVATTAYALLDEREKILSAGFDGYASLPVKKNDYLTTLISSINKFL